MSTARTPGACSASAVSMPSMRAAPCGRAGEGDVQHAGGADVVDEVRVAGQVAAVLDPRDRLPDPAPAQGQPRVQSPCPRPPPPALGGPASPPAGAGSRGWRAGRGRGRSPPRRRARPPPATRPPASSRSASRAAHRDVADAAEHDARLAVVGQRDDHGHEREVAVAARELLHRGALHRRREAHGGDDLVGLERGREVAEQEVLGRDLALAARARRSRSPRRARPRSGTTRRWGRRGRGCRRTCRGCGSARGRPTSAAARMTS